MTDRNPYRTYADGRPKVPHMGALCADRDRTEQDADWGHRVCGGWYCTCPCHDDWDIGSEPEMADHIDHDWVQIDDCVYCSVCAVRLYQGKVGVEANEKRAMAAILSAGRIQLEKEWAHMRQQVVQARAEAVEP